MNGNWNGLKTEIDYKIIYELLPELKKMGVIEFDTEFCEVINLRKQNFTAIKNGDRSFRLNHLELLYHKFNLNMNWLFGNEMSMFRRVIEKNTR